MVKDGEETRLAQKGSFRTAVAQNMALPLPDTSPSMAPLLWASQNTECVLLLHPCSILES